MGMRCSSSPLTAQGADAAARAHSRLPPCSGDVPSSISQMLLPNLGLLHQACTRLLLVCHRKDPHFTLSGCLLFPSSPSRAVQGQ